MKRLRIPGLLCVLVVIGPTVAADACDTWVALRDATADNPVRLPQRGVHGGAFAG